MSPGNWRKGNGEMRNGERGTRHEAGAIMKALKDAWVERRSARELLIMMNQFRCDSRRRAGSYQAENGNWRRFYFLWKS